MRRHVILTLGRSGSNWLTGALNQHPQIVNFGEVLGSWTTLAKLKKWTRPQEESQEYLDRVFRSRSVFIGGQAASAISHMRKRRPICWHRHSKLESIGIKEFATNFERFGLLNYLASRPDIRVISLRRENILKRYVSIEFLRKTHKVRANSAREAQTAKLKFDIDTMFKELELFEKELQIQSDLLCSGNPVHDLTYEKLFDPIQTESQLNQVFSFLGVDPVSVTSGDSKLNTGSLEHLIENYAEVAKALSGTRFEQYLA